MRKYTADFETTVDPNNVRVWAWALYEIGVDNFIYGNNIQDFIKFCSGRENYILYFHNLRS